MDIIGIDVGGVIIDRANDDTDTSFFSENFLRTTSCAGALETINRLVYTKFGVRTHIVSKCGSNIQQKTLQWFDHHRLYEVTGIKRENVHFCRERHQKAGICKELGITHFIDDRLEVLGHLIPDVEHLFLFCPQQKEVNRFSRFLPRVQRVLSWKEVETLILG